MMDRDKMRKIIFINTSSCVVPHWVDTECMDEKVVLNIEDLCSTLGAETKSWIMCDSTLTPKAKIICNKILEMGADEIDIYYDDDCDEDQQCIVITPKTFT